MATIKLLGPPDYSPEEQQALTDFVLALKKSHIQDFLRQVELPKSGTKVDLRERLQEAIHEGAITYEQLVDFLDSVAPGENNTLSYIAVLRMIYSPGKTPTTFGVF